MKERVIDLSPAALERSRGTMVVIRDWMVAQNLVEPAAHVSCTIDEMRALEARLAEAQKQNSDLRSLVAFAHSFIGSAERSSDETRRMFVAFGNSLDAFSDKYEKVKQPDNSREKP